MKINYSHFQLETREKIKSEDKKTLLKVSVFGKPTQQGYAIKNALENDFEKRHAEKEFLSEYFNLPLNQIFFVKQEHGDYCLRVGLIDIKRNTHRQLPFTPNPYIDIGDALYTTDENILLVVRTADCLPIFVNIETPNTQLVGLIHAGWRGLKKNIVSKSLFEMMEKLQLTSSMLPQLKINIWMGPCAGKTRYEVGKEFHQYFLEPHAFHTNRKGVLCLDMKGIAKNEINKGLELYAKTHDYKEYHIKARVNCIENRAKCTILNHKAFYSHRLGDTGRNLNVIGLFTKNI